MVGIENGIGVLGRSLLAFLEFSIPVVATFGAVFLGVYLNGVIDRERQREQEIFRPLLGELRDVKESSCYRPFTCLRDENDEYRSLVLDIPPNELYTVDSETREAIVEYLEAHRQLVQLQETPIAASQLLKESGYSEFVAEQLSDEMLVASDKGIQTHKRDQCPGPHIIAGKRTVVSGRNAVIPDKSTKITGMEGEPLFAMLIAHANLVVELESANELRAFFADQTSVDVAYLDETCSEWADELWEVLNCSWEGAAGNYDDGTFGPAISESALPGIIEGGDFTDVLTTVGIALELKQIKQRQQVINQAEQLYGRLARRVSHALYHPDRLRIARQ